MDPLVTLDELQLHLQRTVDDADRAEQALQLASGAVRAYCDWDLSEETTTLQVPGSGTCVLTLPTLALGEVTEVRVNGTVQDLTLIRPSKRGQLYRSYPWPRFGTVDVDCTHGYDPIPDLVKLVALELAVKGLAVPSADGQSAGLIEATTGRVTRRWADTSTLPRLSALDERLLSKYRI